MKLTAPHLAAAMLKRLNACNKPSDFGIDATIESKNAVLAFAIADYVGDVYGDDVEIGLADLLGVLRGTTERVKQIVEMTTPGVTVTLDLTEGKA